MINFPNWVKVSTCESRSRTDLEKTEHGIVKRIVSTAIQFGTGWNCCKARPRFAIVFDNGARWAVCTSCASQYIGEIQDLQGNTITKAQLTWPTQSELKPWESLAPIADRVNESQSPVR